jgi:ribose 5-phosphate isomerase B
VRISVSADEDVGIARGLLDELRRRGHDAVPHGALADEGPDEWAMCTEQAVRDVAEGRAQQAIVCCWTGTGASIAANKVPGIRAALCNDAATAEGARKWNDANVLALSLRATSQPELTEILDAWFSAQVSSDPADRAQIDHVNEMDEQGTGG